MPLLAFLLHSGPHIDIDYNNNNYNNNYHENYNYNYNYNDNNYNNSYNVVLDVPKLLGVREPVPARQFSFSGPVNTTQVAGAYLEVHG